MLRRLMNNKMNHLWDAEDENCLEQIQKESLSASQQLDFDARFKVGDRMENMLKIQLPVSGQPINAGKVWI